jgi:hypothetical protein
MLPPPCKDEIMETADPSPKAADAPAADIAQKPGRKTARTRRTWSAEDKATIALEVEKDGPAAVARRYNIDPSTLSAWRKQRGQRRGTRKPAVRPGA